MKDNDLMRRVRLLLIEAIVTVVIGGCGSRAAPSDGGTGGGKGGASGGGGARGDAGGGGSGGSGAGGSGSGGGGFGGGGGSGGGGSGGGGLAGGGSGGGGSGGGDGSGDAGPGDASQMDGMGSESGVDAGVCAQQTFPTTGLPVDALIVQDKSASMANDFSDVAGCTGALCKWPSMTTALVALVSRTETAIDWGISFFPNGSIATNCTVTAGAMVAPGPMNAAAITAAISTTVPSGRTPTRAAIANAAAYLNSFTSMSGKYILLATDGEPNCLGATAGADDAGAIAAVAAAYDSGAGIPVFVLGIGNVAAAESTLNSMALAGGRAQATPVVDPTTAVGRVYYPADSPAQLDASLSLIADQLTSCAFQLAATPPDPTNIAVLGDGHAIQKDPANGWSYASGMTSIVLNGTSCLQLKTGSIHQIDTVFGCSGIGIVIP